MPTATASPRSSKRSLQPLLHHSTASPTAPLSKGTFSTNRPNTDKVDCFTISLNEMDAVDIPSERVPEGLKACEQILKRAKELKRAEPVVAYWCCFSAAEKVLKVHGRTKEQTMFLMSLLDALERMKSVLANNDAVTNEAAGAAHVENFALKVFMSADNDDRNGVTGKATIRKFVVAGQFIEVLKCFENGMTEEMEQKLQYGRWKAADGAKALREGREPTSGPPIADIENSPFPTLPTDTPSTATRPLSATPPLAEPGPSNPPASSKDATPVISPRPSPGPGLIPKGNLPSIDTSSTDNLRTPGRTHSSGSGAWSTVATPGVQDDGAEQHFPEPQTSTPPAAESGEITPLATSSKNVRFMGPDGAPLSPAQTHITVDSYDAPDAPPPTTFDPSPTDDLPPPPATSSPAVLPPPPPLDAGFSHARTNSAPRPGNQPSPAPHPSALPPPPPPSLANYPSQPAGALGISSPPPTAPPLSSFAPPSGPITLNRKQTETVQKHARWAISALEFDDFETARTELRKALAVMGG